MKHILNALSKLEIMIKFDEINFLLDQDLNLRQ